jgi:formylglycine-generating enzyme
VSARRLEAAVLAVVAGTLPGNIIGCLGPADLPPEGQILLYVDTDAPVPPEPGEELEDNAQPPLFDRLRIELYRPGEREPCQRCTHDFALDRGRLEAGMSVGLLLRTGVSGYRARARIYRQAFLLASDEKAEPIPQTTLDATLELPAVAAEGIALGTIFLGTEEVGRQSSTPDSPASWSPGAPVPGSPWRPHRIACTGAPRTGEICVPGGAFWMGHPGVAGGRNRDDAPRPRLVVLSPYFLDRSEVTVGAFRSWLLESSRDGTSDDPARSDYPPGKTVITDWCTLPRNLSDPSRDDLPLNCISKERAREYCRTRGADLPSEAELEYAAGGLTSQLYVWGSDQPACDDAVFARAGRGHFADRLPGDCRRSDPGGPEPIEAGSRDFVRVGGSEIRGLAGSLSELVRDAWAAQAVCREGLLLVDPECTGGAPGAETTLKGGSWGSEPYELRAAFRAEARQYKETWLGPLVGFRCARPAVSIAERSKP